jgi:hypothetical protein
MARRSTAHLADQAIADLAAWIVNHARKAAPAKRMIEALVKAQQGIRSSNAGIQEGLRGSDACREAQNLRDHLLVLLSGCPFDLLYGFPWKFGTDADRLPRNELLGAVRMFVEELWDEDFDPATADVCRTDEIVLRSPQVVVMGACHPSRGQPRFFTIALRPDKGKVFRAGELWCKMVNAAAEHLRDSGHRFFHGLRLIGQVGNPVAWVPLYEMQFSSDWTQPGLDPQIGWGSISKSLGRSDDPDRPVSFH